MDLREKKTLRSITNAFIQLRKRKQLERISVKELAELAEISKATFYLHYKDIYDLSEHLQDEVIQKIFCSIVHPEYCLTDPMVFTEELYYAFYANQTLIDILFSGTQNMILPMRIEQELIKFIKKQYPDIDIEAEMLLTYTIHGGYNLYQKYYKTNEINGIISIICHASKMLLSRRDDE